MAMISKLLVERFRGINNLEIKNLNRINLFVGDNNCGKTSVMEALVTLKREWNHTYSRILPGREVAKNREAFGFEVRL